MLEEYARLALDYDTRWSFYVEATTRETTARLSLRPTDQLLDVGCGTGALLDHLALSHPPSRLFGVDPVPEMLAIARRRLPPAVRLCQGWAERLPFKDEQFDIVSSCNVFHYIRHPLAALREMGRVLRPRGQLVITDWCADYLACRLCDLYLRVFNRAHFRVCGARECAQLLRQAGHSDVDIECYKISRLWGLMAARTTKNAN